MNRLAITGAVAAALAGGLFFFQRGPAPDGKAEASHEQRDAGISRGLVGVDGFVESHVEPLPEGASDYPERATRIATMPPDTVREEAIRALAQEWAAESRVDAERWASSLPDPVERKRALTYVCLQAAGLEPREAIEAAEWHRLDGVVEAIAGRWANADFSAAARWAGALPAGDSRDRILSRLVLARAATEPSEAAQIVSESFPSGARQEEAAIAVLHQWLLKDPDQARAWVALFPSGPLKMRAEEEILGLATYGADANGDQAAIGAN